MKLFEQPYFSRKTEAAPLAVFRIFFGILMFISVIRFWSNGWIEKFYIQPSFFFSYYGFEWVKPLGSYTYLLFVICGLSALFVAIGFRYRIAIVTFWLSFTYIELMDKTTYLNHYYFISLLSFLMIFLPAEGYFSVDSKNHDNGFVPQWSIDSIKLLLGIVYVYAGLAKLNSDWLIEAMPLKIWLPTHNDLPLLGAFLQKEWVIYAFSWGGMMYDLSIPFLLLSKRFRTFGFAMVVFFHVLTSILFPIGMFPYIMIVSALIFFEPAFHERLIQFLKNWFRIRTDFQMEKHVESIQKWKGQFLIVFFLLQLLLPWRYLLYPGELFWHEQGYRFSWRVMLMEKVGYAQFKMESEEGNFYINNDEFLTTFQEKQMSTQPDFILEYAHFLKSHYQQLGYTDPKIYVESFVALNGRRSSPFIDPKVNLAAEKESFKTKQWILPFRDEIKGF